MCLLLFVEHLGQLSLLFLLLALDSLISSFSSFLLLLSKHLLRLLLFQLKLFSVHSHVFEPRRGFGIHRSFHFRNLGLVDRGAAFLWVFSVGDNRSDKVYMTV